MDRGLPAVDGALIDADTQVAAMLSDVLGGSPDHVWPVRTAREAEPDAPRPNGLRLVR